MKGALAGAFTSWLALIALHAVASNGGSGRISELAGDVDRFVKRALDPAVPAIPDLRAGAAAAAMTPAQAAATGYVTPSAPNPFAQRPL